MLFRLYLVWTAPHFPSILLRVDAFVVIYACTLLSLVSLVVNNLCIQFWLWHGETDASMSPHPLHPVPTMGSRERLPRFYQLLLTCPSQFLIGLDGDACLVGGNLWFAPSIDRLEVYVPDLKAGMWETIPPFGGDGNTYVVVLRWVRERQGDELALERSIEEWKRDEESYRASVLGRRGEDVVSLPQGLKWVRAGSYNHDCASGVVLARAYLSEESARKIMGSEEVNLESYYSSLQHAHADVRGCDTRTVGGLSFSLMAEISLWKAVDAEGKTVAVRIHVNGMTRREEHEEMGAGNYESDGGPYSDDEDDSDYGDE
ncbi:hypothetical protein CALCODRAFT_69164 [Calocera cornea HHB12733]|uniref:Uncharacterized protein n=1 Tax=Calocera cornea HHB12733 TaxID=1353952 RepID=A0A165DIK6_9BASI|nr:hypothetical protein CALCODRAFT_69164 [Calocera cornea HHB12733]